MLPSRPRGRCAISWGKAHLDAEDADAVDRLIHQMRWLNNYVVADLLNEEGFDTDYQTIQRHRTGRCRTCTLEAKPDGATGAAD